MDVYSDLKLILYIEFYRNIKSEYCVKKEKVRQKLMNTLKMAQHHLYLITNKQCHNKEWINTHLNKILSLNKLTSW